MMLTPATEGWKIFLVSNPMSSVGFEWKLSTKFDIVLIFFLWPQLMTNLNFYAKKAKLYSNGKLLEMQFAGVAFSETQVY